MGRLGYLRGLCSSGVSLGIEAQVKGGGPRVYQTQKAT